MPSQPLSKWEYGVSCIKASNARSGFGIISVTSVVIKKIAPVLFHSCVVQYRGYPVEYFFICCDLLPRVRLQLTAVKQLAL